MDLTFIIPNLGVAEIIFNFNVEETDPTFLVSLTDPSGVSTKVLLLSPSGCDGSWIVVIDSVNISYEDLLDGLIHFNHFGTWEGKIYSQLSTSNINPDNAVFITNALFQVIDDEDQFLLNKPINLPL